MIPRISGAVKRQRKVAIGERLSRLTASAVNRLECPHWWSMATRGTDIPNLSYEDAAGVVNELAARTSSLKSASSMRRIVV